MEKFVTKLQVNLNHSTEAIVGAQAITYLLKSKMLDVPEDHNTIWCAMGDVIKKLISHGAFLDNLDIDGLMMESREAHLLTVRNKKSVGDAMAQATAAAAKVVSVSATMAQLVTPVLGGRLYAMNNALNMGDQNIGFLQQTLTVLCNAAGTLDQKVHHMYYNGTAQLIKGSLTDATRDDFEVQLSTLTAELDGVRQLTEGGGLNKFV